MGRSHGDFLEGSNGGLKRSCVVAGKDADTIGAEDRNKEQEFAAIEEFVKGSREQSRVDGDIGRRSDQEEWSRVRKEDGMESWLRVQKIEGTETRGRGGAGGG